MSLLFETARRPVARDISQLESRAGTFSISEISPTGDDARGIWLEILTNGLTFDLAGLAPGEASAMPDVMHRFGLSENIDLADSEAVALTVGPHLSGGETLLPVIRSQMALAAQLCELPGLKAVAWGPAQCVSSPSHFESAILRWLDGGVFPGLGLTALEADATGAMRSVGLSFFIGKELRLAPELASDRQAAAKLALRLVHELVEAGGLTDAQQVVGPDDEQLVLAVSADGQFVDVGRPH